MIVADTNLVSYLLIEGERTEEARRVWRRDPAWMVAPLWRSEFLNVLALLVRTTVLEADQARVIWPRAAALLRSNEFEPGGSEVLDAAIHYGISAYDAHFVAVAEQLGARLVTSDRELLERCSRQTVSIARFADGG